MYFFVRFTGWMMVVFGVLFMLAGLAAAIYGFVQFQALTDLFTNYVFAGTNQPLPDPRILFSVGGLVLFVVGMTTSAFGQLLLVFADLANHTRETNVLLRAMKRS